MTLFRSLFAFMVAMVVILSCRKELSSEGGELPGADENTWEFTTGGVLSSGPMDSGYVQSIGTVATLSMVGSTIEDEQGEIFLQIVGESIAAGTYTNPLVFFQYSENGT